MSQRTLRFSGGVALLSIALTACGGSDGGTGGDAPTPDTSSAAPASETPAAPAGGVTFVDKTDAAATVTLSADGFDPAEVEVAVGDVVAFVTDEGQYSVIVGDLDGYTVASSIDEYFRFDQPGTYPVREDLTGATATVTVS